VLSTIESATCIKTEPFYHSNLLQQQLTTLRTYPTSEPFNLQIALLCHCERADVHCIAIIKGLCLDNHGVPILVWLPHVQ
jgi:hypothetical protein